MIGRVESAQRRRHIGAAAATVVAGAIMLVGPTPAAAQESLAASCPLPRDDYVANGSSGERFAQTFVSGFAGNLTRAEIDFLEPAGKTGDYVVQIMGVDGSGTPNNNVLASTTVPEVPDGPTTLVATFASPAAIVAGQSYALVLSRPSEPTIEGGEGLEAGYKPDTADCPGTFWYSPGGTTTWNTVGVDMIFAVFATPPEPLPPVKVDRTVTLDANKGKVKKGRKVVLFGKVDAPQNEAACEAAQAVEVQRLKGGSFETIEQVQTDGQGNFLTKTQVKKTFLYRAHLGETADCVAANSDTEKVKIKKTK